MRSHRLFGVVIAVLLGSSFLHQRPSSPDHHRHHSAGVHVPETAARLTSTASPVDDPYASSAPGADASILLLQPGAAGHSPAHVQSASLVDPADTSQAEVDPKHIGLLRPAGTRYMTLLYAWESYMKAHGAPSTPPTSSATPAIQAVSAVDVTHHSVPLAPTTTPTPPATKASGSVSGGVWASLRQCESGGNYKDDTGNGYYGAYQFALGTWHGLGFSGLPSNASPAVQDEAAQELQSRSGWGQWPACSRMLRLL
jgi:hypothetical protein